MAWATEGWLWGADWVQESEWKNIAAILTPEKWIFKTKIMSAHVWTNFRNAATWKHEVSVSKRSFQKGKMKKIMCFPPVSFFHLASFFESGLNLKVLFFNSGHLIPHESSFVCISQRRTFRNHAFQCRKPGQFHFSGFLYFALFSALTIWSNDVKWCQIYNFSTCTVGFPNNHSSKW